MISHVLGLTRSDFQIFAATRSSSKAVWFPVGIRMFDVLFSLYHYDFFQFFFKSWMMINSRIFWDQKKPTKTLGITILDDRQTHWKAMHTNDTTFRRLCNRRVTSNGPSKILGWEIDKIFGSNYSQITKKLIGFLKISKSSTKNFLETIKNGADSTFRTT